MFRYQHQHRPFILEEILSLAVKLPEIQNAAKKSSTSLDVSDPFKFRQFGCAWGHHSLNPTTAYKTLNGSSIHLISALILQLVQCTFDGWLDRGIVDEEQGECNHDEKIATKIFTLAKQANNTALSCCLFVWTYLVRKCQKSLTEHGKSRSRNKKEMDELGEETSALSDYRMVLDGLVGDVINIIGAPEWPIASVMLQGLSAVLCDILSGGQNNEVPVNIECRQLAVEVLW
jgi:hypothetical protein